MIINSKITMMIPAPIPKAMTMKEPLLELLLLLFPSPALVPLPPPPVEGDWDPYDTDVLDMKVN